MTIVADKSDIAVLSKVQLMLEKATTTDEIREVENLAQLARKYAKDAGLGRDAVNRAQRVALDARRKAGATLKAMKERGELAERGRKQIYQRGRFTLRDLGLTFNDSSFYQLEASVPQKRYVEWVERVTKSRSGMLTASGLRELARQLADPGGCDGPPVLFPAAARRIRRLLGKLWKRMAGDGRARLAGFLKSLSSQYGGRAAAETIECVSASVGPVCRTGLCASNLVQDSKSSGETAQNSPSRQEGPTGPVCRTGERASKLVKNLKSYCGPAQQSPSRQGV